MTLLSSLGSWARRRLAPPYPALLALTLPPFRLHQLPVSSQWLIEHGLVILDGLADLFIFAEFLHNGQKQLAAMFLIVASLFLHVAEYVRITDQRLQLHVFIFNCL